MEKSKYIKSDSDEVNMASEPAMVYGYANQTNYESTLIEKFNSVEGFAVDEITPKSQIILQPDDDLRRAITMEQLREQTHKVIDKFFANK